MRRPVTTTRAQAVSDTVPAMRTARGGMASAPHSAARRGPPPPPARGGAAVRAPVEDERVDAGHDHYEDLHAEEDVVVVAKRLGVEEEEARYGHDDEARVGPGQEAPREGLHGNIAEGEAGEPQVHHDGGADEETQGEDVGGLHERPRVERFEERDAPRRFAQPPQEPLDHGWPGPRLALASAAESDTSLGRMVSVAYAA